MIGKKANKHQNDEHGTLEGETSSEIGYQLEMNYNLQYCPEICHTNLEKSR